MKTYDIDILTDSGIKKLDKMMNTLENILVDNEFKEYIANKAQAELEKICIENLHNLESYDIEGHYLGGMYVVIEDDVITLGNNSMVDIEAKNMSPETKARYFSGLSLAKIVEFGVGAKGSDDDDWKTNINQQEHIQKYGRDGWYYLDDGGNIHWTTGIEGKFIFYKLSEKIKENIADWINEYISDVIEREVK